ncbi:PAS domain-containing protein, partial [Thermopolyspora sp. NPDC052614]|uniref:PAS domain-containing protein n=1 Tax=Thermopolyspora sp. NPDC052614 TaxID=3155682 RepID=UPI00344273D4
MSERRYPAPHPPYPARPADHPTDPHADRWDSARMPRGGPAGGPMPADASSGTRRSPSGPGDPISAAGRWEWNPRTDELRCDQAALAVLGIDPARYDGRVETWFKAVHPDDLPGVLAERDNAIRTRGTFTAEYRVGRADGSLGWVTECGHVLPAADGLPALMVGALWDSGHAAPAGRAVRFMSDGFLVLDGEWRIRFANVAAERLLGGSGGLTGRSLPEVCPQVDADEWERHRRTLATGVPAEVSVWMPGTRRWYRLRLVGVRDGVAGGKAPTYTGHITDFTDHMAVIAERTAAERAAAERTARIRELTGALAEAVTVQDVVDAVARHVLPPFGATGFHVSFVVGDHLQSAGSVGYTSPFVDEVRRLPLAARYPLPDAIRERALRFITSAEEYVALYPHLAHIPLRGRKNAWVFLPLIASGQVFGGCAISFTHPRRFTDEERSLLTAISGLLSQALARARLYDAERTRAQELQRALLPRKLPSLPAVTVTARYLPAGKDMEVGGDWYDIIPLSADRVALVI